MSARTNLLTARASLRPLALKCLNWQGLNEFSLNTVINVCCSGLTCARALSARWRNKWLLIFQHTAFALNKSEWFVHFFFIAVVVMYWETRMRFHQQKQTLDEPCLFYVLFITNHIIDALSDLSWTAVLVRAERCVENRTVRIFFFTENRSTPNV